ncbi:MAG: FAD-dependent oxidoreductase [Proteobacteria bacterium]|nr:FAD-dependent oxidoreductase [Pseudomonadota bacterium]
MPHAVIVGAGPAGAALAYLLARRGIEVTLLERARDFEREFRGEVLMPSAFDALGQMGLGKLVAEVPQVRIRRVRVYLDGRPLLAADLDAAAFGGVPPALVSQPRLLEALVARAGVFERFRLLRGAVVRDVLSRSGRVVGVRAQTPDGEREIRGDVVIGADGRASVIRRRSGARVRASRTRMDVVWCKLPLPDFQGADPHLRGYLGGGHLLIAAPAADGRLQLGWVIRKGRYGELRARGIAEWIEQLARHVSPDLAGHLLEHRSEAVHPFLLDVRSDRVARWCNQGAWLIGDAAHTLSPVGAQGLNIAVRDSLVAANHLLPALLAGARPDALDAAAGRFQAERLPEVRTIQRLQALAPPLVLSPARWARLLLRASPLALRFMPSGGAVARRFANGVTQVKLRV